MTPPSRSSFSMRLMVLGLVTNNRARSSTDRLPPCPRTSQHRRFVVEFGRARCTCLLHLAGYGLDLWWHNFGERLGPAFYAHLFEHIDEELCATLPMAPGQLDRQLTDQEKVVSLLLSDSPGITLTEGSVLQPKKSATCVFGIRKQDQIRCYISSCQRCPGRRSCDFRCSDR